MTINELAPSIWEITGAAEGPSVAILGGTHGNERTGVEVVRRLVADFSSGARTVAAGTVYLVLGNLEAIALNQRSTAPGGGSTGGAHDLNRMFEQARFDREPDGTYEDARAREMASLVLNRVEYSIDLHSVNKPSVPFLPCASTPRHERMYRWFDTDLVVDDPNFLLGDKPVTTDEYVTVRGGVGICFETGYSSDTSKVDDVFASILNVLRDLGNVQDGGALPTPKPKTVYTTTDKIVIDERGFAFADGMGETSFQPFHTGDVIGTQGDVPYLAPYDGVLIFPEMEEKFAPGIVATWLAREKRASC